jgi:hypothetical protein
LDEIINIPERTAQALVLCVKYDKAVIPAWSAGVDAKGDIIPHLIAANPIEYTSNTFETILSARNSRKVGTSSQFRRISALVIKRPNQTRWLSLSF